MCRSQHGPAVACKRKRRAAPALAMQAPLPRHGVPRISTAAPLTLTAKHRALQAVRLGQRLPGGGLVRLATEEEQRASKRGKVLAVAELRFLGKVWARIRLFKRAQPTPAGSLASPRPRTGVHWDPSGPLPPSPFHIAPACCASGIASSSLAGLERCTSGAP